MDAAGNLPRPSAPSPRPDPAASRSSECSVTMHAPAPSPLPDRTLEHAGASILVFADAATACHAAADRFADTLRSALRERGRAVLGLATGATPVRLYASLVARHRRGELSFANAATYNLDEYYPISPFDPKSYRSYMHRHLFGH